MVWNHENIFRQKNFELDLIVTDLFFIKKYNFFQSFISVFESYGLFISKTMVV